MSDTCACYIIKRNGDPLTTADYDKDSPDAPSRIDLCPLHAAAPALLEALEHVLERYDNLNAEYAASQGSAGDGPWIDDGMTRMARATIAQARRT